MPKNAYIEKHSDSSENMRNIREGAGAYLDRLRHLKQSEKTVEIRRISCEKFISFLAGSGINGFSDVDPEALELFRLRLVDSGLSESSVDIHMRSVAGLFGFLGERNLLFENPFRRIRMRAPKRRKMDVLSKAEVKKLLAVPSRIQETFLRNRAILETLYATGMRLGELVYLRLDDVDLASRSLRVFGKGKKERLLPLGKHAADYIGRYLRDCRPLLAGPGHPDCDALWLDRNGRKMAATSVTMILVGAGRRAGIKRRISCHLLRRSCATHMLVNKAHPVMIAKMLGHSGLKTLSHYLNISIADLMKTHAKSRPGK